METEPLQSVPTNIVTGFLGVGKTSAILHLLQQKPASERWAVLINEFGEIGIDGSLVQGQTSGSASGSDTGIHIKEVPGGCMCCAAGLPMQIALNLLLQQARPQRLLIEPTGLGHPIEVMQALSAEHYREVLALQKVVTLVDARKLSDERYTAHPTFRQQLDIADVIVANKEDLYAEDDRAALQQFISQHQNPNLELHITRQGKIDQKILDGKSLQSFAASESHQGHSNPTLASELPFPTDGMVSADNAGEGFASKGWRFSPNKLFDRNRLRVFLSGLEVERLKAVFITESGIFGYNMTPDALTEVGMDDCAESRIEIIAEQINPDWEQALRDCISGEW